MLVNFERAKNPLPVVFAIEQPADVDVGEIIVRPTGAGLIRVRAARALAFRLSDNLVAHPAMHQCTNHVHGVQGAGKAKFNPAGLIQHLQLIGRK